MIRVPFSLPFLFIISITQVFCQTTDLVDSLMSAGKLPMNIPLRVDVIGPKTNYFAGGSPSYTYIFQKGSQIESIRYFPGTGPFYFKDFSFPGHSDTTFIPRIHVVYHSAYTQLEKWTTEPSFAIDYRIKNFNDTTGWHRGNFKTKIILRDVKGNTLRTVRYGEIPLPRPAVEPTEG